MLALKPKAKVGILIALAVFVLLIALAVTRRGRNHPLERKPLLPRSSSMYNVLWISIDALRADHLGCYGYNRPTSPHINQLSKKSAVFLETYSQSSFTLPSSFSFLSSLYPSSHGLTLSSVPQEKTVLYVYRNNVFGQMANYGYHIRGLVNSWYGAGLEKVYPEINMGSGSAVEMNREAVDFMEANRDNPFFLLLHYMEVHTPYIPRKGYIEKFADPAPTAAIESDFLNMVNNRKREVSPEKLRQIVDIYDSNIRYLDDRVDELLTTLADLGIDDRTIVIVTADHGEAFLEHGYLGHSLKLYEQYVRIPLIIKVPGLTDTGAIIKSRARSIDLFPTLCDLLDQKPPPRAQGTSLLPLIKTRQADQAERDVFAEVFMHPGYYTHVPNPGPECRNIEAVVSGPWKYIHYLATDRRELFNLEQDPGEQNNLAAAQPDQAAAMEQKLENQLALNLAGGGVDVRQELGMTTNEYLDRITKVVIPMAGKLSKQLKSLGYLQ